jgi:hypothetical protein
VFLFLIHCNTYKSKLLTIKLKKMKNLMKVAATLLLIVAFTQNSKAQFKFNAGIDFGYVMEDGMGLMYGLAIGGEIPVGDNMGVTIESGYDMLAIEGEGASASLIPFQGGFKYYFDDNEGGMYLHGQAGYTIYTLTFEFFGITSSASEGYLSFAPGAGYLVNEHIDLGIDYNMILASGGSLKYIALRAAYKF